MVKIIQNGRPSHKYPSYRNSPKILLTVYDSLQKKKKGQGMSAEGNTDGAFVPPKF